MRDLAEACEMDFLVEGAEARGRLSALAGCLADVVVRASADVGREQRWAMAVELASAARVVTSYAVVLDTRGDARLTWAHHSADHRDPRTPQSADR
jgi:hypothetical protein